GPCTVTLTQPSQLTLTCSGVNPSKCNTVCDGTATANPSGGTAPYTYLWSNGQTGKTATGLCATPAGTSYSVTVTDANNCTAGPCSVTLTQPSQLTLTCSGNNPSPCNTVCNGTATANPSGGTAPYKYLWSNGQTTQTATGLCATPGGTSYLVTVT